MDAWVQISADPQDTDRTLLQRTKQSQSLGGYPFPQKDFGPGKYKDDIIKQDTEVTKKGFRNGK